MPEITKVSWDLSDLYSGIDDPRIEEDLNNSIARAHQFAERYRGKIDSDDLTAETLLAAIKEYESIAQEMGKTGSYSALVFSADTSNPEHGALMQHVQERQTAASLELIFFELELMAAKPEIIDPVVKNPIMDKYRHFVHASRLFREHRLPESEERILEEKANTGSRAFERLFEESVSAMEFKVVVNGEEKILNESERSRRDAA
jgi:oligoendopeptidase F